MTGRIVQVEIEKTKTGGKQDGETELMTLFTFPDGKLEGGPFEFLDERFQKALEEGRKEADKEREKARQELRGTEFSETYFDPTLLEVEVDARIKAYAVIKTRGIQRPYALHLCSENTHMLYVHESGILGFYEIYGIGLKMITLLPKFHEVVRIPFRVARDIGMKKIKETYPYLEIDLAEPEKGEGNFCEGDLCYKRSFVTDKEDIEKGSPLTMKHMQEVGLLVENIGSKIDGSHERKAYEINDFGNAGDVARYLWEIEKTPWDVGLNVNPCTAIINEKGIIARLYSEIAQTGFIIGNVEMMIPLPIVDEIKKRGIKTDIKLLDEYVDNLDNNILETSNKRGEYDEEVFVTGDIIHSWMIRKGCYEEIKGRVNELGGIYLDNRMKCLQVFTGE